ncbi:Multidrug resistance protein MdtK [Rosistilla carotiformis]|uniref:Multidrug-efflux transporter n=1 Tax=Rosistilla carotiformis TaxID=2528017 RepID=A0A518JTM9_9BACT|nr:MATE family efflux transporter [Rosistilla carotiformis]QDV68888.1 Multidrug resistance protein MdtK [Rosistilla carotiformis]
MNIWNRPAGIAEVLRVALPLMISTGCLTLTLFSDRTMLLWYGQPEMAASMAGGNLFWTLTCFPVGIVSMTSAMVAQYSGSGQPQRIGRLIWQAIWFSLAISPLLWMLIPLSRSIFVAAGQDPSLLDLESIYLQWLLVGASAVVLESALAGFFSGTERTAIVMWVNIAASIVNLVLDVVLIFGYAGFPELGIVGAGIASSISFWTKAIIYLVLMHRRADTVRFGIAAGRVVDFPLLRRLLYFGVPAGLQYQAESGGFAMIVLQIGQVGTEALAATAMAINFNMMAFVPLIGVSIAASVLVGKHLTESGPSLAARAAISAALLGVCYSATWATAYVLIPDTLLSLYLAGNQGEAIAPTIALARVLLRFVAVYCIFDAAQIVIGGALRGAGDTWFVLFASVSVAVLWVTVGLIGKPYSSNPLHWWWWMLTCWVMSMAAAMLGRFAHGRWRTLRMVEAADSSIAMVS